MAELCPTLVDLIRKFAGDAIGRDPDRIGDTDHLFDVPSDGELAAGEVNLGGDSLDRMELVMALEEELQLEIEGDDIRQHFVSVSTIATYLTGRSVTLK